MTYAGSYPWDYFSGIPFGDAVLTIWNAHIQHIEDREFLQWVVWGQLDKDFESFKKTQHPKKRKAEDILKEVYGYIDQFNEGYAPVVL